MFSRISSAMSYYLLPSSYSKTSTSVADENRVKQTESTCGFVVVDEFKDDIQEADLAPRDLIHSLNLNESAQKSLSMIIDLIALNQKEMKPKAIQILASLLARDLNLDPSLKPKDIIQYIITAMDKTDSNGMKKDLGLEIDSQKDTKNINQVRMFVKWNRLIKQLNQQSNLLDANLSEMNLSNLDFSNLNMKFCNLQKSQLDGTKFEGSELIGANFMGTGLKKADFVSTQVRQAKFD